MTRPLRALSLGAGRQSSTALLMSAHGDLELLDVAVFADTHGETAATYAWLNDVLAPAAEAAGIELITVSKGDLAADHLAAIDRVSQIPAFVANPDGTRGRINRRCSRDYKVRPIRRAARAAMRARGLTTVEQWVGFAWEETGRVNEAETIPAYITTRYPLIEHRITSADCASWLADHGYPPAPRSACWFCPHARDPRWLELRRRRPDDFERAVAFDRDLREHGIPGIDGTVYLHESLTPLGEAIEAASSQGTLFDTDCADGCMT